MDFLSILLSGTLLTHLLMSEVGSVVLEDRYAKLARAEAWAALLFASNLFGHLVFLLGFRFNFGLLVAEKLELRDFAYPSVQHRETAHTT